MKITCQACAAKYTIADEKVLGKIVKIRCKKCGATILVNGSDPSANAGAATSEPPRAYDAATQGAPGASGVPGAAGEPWTVNVADGDQRSMGDHEIVDAYRAGVVHDETFCWKDGMADWLPIREIDSLYAGCTATRVAAVLGAAGGLASLRTPPEDNAETKIQPAAPAFLRHAAAPTAHGAPRPAGASPGNGMTAAAAPTAAARRTGGRAPAADLFRGAAQAGSEEDVMTSAPVGMPEVHEDSAKLTGQRNENSVLFSLNALSTKGPAPSTRPMAASSEASGLIDIRQLSAQIGLGDDQKKKSRIDDIMNLSGGATFNPSLAAPVLSAPSIEEYAVPEGAARGGAVPVGGRSKALLFGAVGAGVLVVAGAIGVAVMVMGKPSASDADKAAASGTSATGAAPSTSAGMTAPAATGSDTSAAAAPSPTDTSTASGGAAPPTPTATKGAPTTLAAAPTTPSTTATTKPATTAATAATTPPAAAAGADQPFNMGEAKARLASIAGSVQGCKKGDLSGSGRVVVTFAPSGGVSSAVVSGVPFEGTPTGACVASRFRGAHVPAFTGSPFSVSKSFTIN
jgi:predicted Zn finger-like uncharacterized protein